MCCYMLGNGGRRTREGLLVESPRGLGDGSAGGEGEGRKALGAPG